MQATSSRPLARVLPVVLCAAGCAVLLGYSGFRALPREVAPVDALYRSLQLFLLEGSFPRAGVPWQLDAGRYLAAGVSAYALIATAIALLRDQAQEARVRAFARNHIVIIGLGATGTVVARALRKKQNRVVAIEADASSPRIQLVRREGVQVVVGDATHPPVLRAARVDRARHVIIMTGDDSKNLEALACAQGIAGAKSARGATFHVAMLDVELWKELARNQLSGRGTKASTEFLNLADRTSLALVGAAVARSGPAAFKRIMVDGDGALAARTAVHALRTAVDYGHESVIVLSSTSEEAELSQGGQLEPWCHEAASIVQSKSASHDPRDDPTLAFLCPHAKEGDAAAIGRAVALSTDLPETEIFVAVYRESTGRALEIVEANRRIHLVTAKAHALADELIEGSALEALARARHAEYVARERERGVSLSGNPSLADWSDLPPSLRDSNRRFAASVADTLADLGASLRPLTGQRSQAGFHLPEERLDHLARREHDRWVEDLVADGWRQGDGTKDPDRKLHPLLVPWEHLDESERDKDRDPFRALPEMLAKIGYEIAPARPDQPDAPSAR